MWWGREQMGDIQGYAMVHGTSDALREEKCQCVELRRDEDACAEPDAMMMMMNVREYCDKWGECADANAGALQIQCR